MSLHRQNIILIGNGFDLAHNFKTSYKHFVHHIFKKFIVDNNSYPDLLSPDIKINRYSIDEFDLSSIQLIGNNINAFFQKIVESLNLNKWCDIEKLYFELLVNKYNHNFDVESLNNDFDLIKHALYQYLSSINLNVVPILGYTNFFENFNSGRNLVINFNYTTTIHKYLGGDCNLLNIHGQLSGNHDEIIFGYGADKKKLDNLYFNDSNSFLKNIKSVNYNRTDNEKVLKEYINRPYTKSNLFILGHSCGESDEYLIQMILESGSIDNIIVSFYPDYSNYIELYTNLQRMMRKVKYEIYFFPFDQTPKMLQHNDNETINTEFVTKMNEIIKKTRTYSLSH